ncbi:MAG TPA: FAD-dependent oxidoreductase [Blastocatellia bacterium]|nr:FAD-dependent oxidoreductase [Blastocatellia bacterium]
MVVNIKTTQMQAMQLWLKPDASGLGWPYPPALISVYSEPINTWADMSHLLPREGWAQADAPQNIAYFCGLLEDTDEIAPYSDSQFPQTQLDRVKGMSVEFLNSMAGSFWPEAVEARGNFKWDLLAGAEDGAGAEALDSQYLRANINPTERYVLSVPGSAQYRLSSEASGFSNLYLAGDWVRTAINAGCVEAATMAGLQASRAICGYPKEIIGDKRILYTIEVCQSCFTSGEKQRNHRGSQGNS